MKKKHFNTSQNINNMKKTVALLYLLITSSLVFAQANAKDYIEKHKNIAIQQMAETAVPASISLAQGMLESVVGTSTLATQANNHFRLLCDENWEGDAIYQTTNGQETCYKVFNSSAESYIEHTNKLAQNPKYENLFYIEQGNYKRWAKGLETLHYSTTPNYAEQLIQVIELYELDKITPSNSTAQNSAPTTSTNEILSINDLRAAVANENETPLEFAARLRIPLRKVLKYNDLTLSQQFYPGQYVFLENKKSKYTGDSSTHQVQRGDNMYLISQQYGVQLNKLLSKNRLKEGEEPRVGEKVYLKKKAPQKPILRSSTFMPTVTPPTTTPKTEDSTPTQQPVRIITPPSTVSPPTIVSPPQNTSTMLPKNETPSTTIDTSVYKIEEVFYVYPDDPVYEFKEDGSKKTNQKTNPIKAEVPEVINKPIIINAPVPPNVHVVQKGDTLYSISKKYNVSVLYLKELNGLTSNEIEINQHIRYK